MATSTTKLTIDDFERLPQEQAENHELVNGELIEMSGNTFEHHEIQDFLCGLLRAFVREHRLGKVVSEQEYDFGGDAHGPDISFFGLAKKALVERRKRVQRFVPDLAIEIVSANDTFESLLDRIEKYRRAGTEEAWILAPRTREVFVFSSRGDRILSGDAELNTDLLPGFRISVRRLFEEAAE